LQTQLFFFGPLLHILPGGQLPPQVFVFALYPHASGDLQLHAVLPGLMVQVVPSGQLPPQVFVFSLYLQVLAAAA
jgi:hypothetical protein